jgi:hypothetical protein
VIGHRLANRLLRLLTPWSAIRHAGSFGWDDQWLADVEADHEVWEPRFTATSPSGGGTTDSPPVVQFAGGDDTGNVVVVGEPFKTDDEVVAELVADFTAVIRQWLNDSRP